MKNLFLVLSMVALFASIQAQAGRESGGTMGAPRAVVLQGHLKNGQYDYIGWQKALAFASQQLGQNIAVVVAHPDRLQTPDRIYMCIEYKDFDAFNIATAQFRALLAPHPSVEIVQNSSCPRS